MNSKEIKKNSGRIKWNEERKQTKINKINNVLE